MYPYNAKVTQELENQYEHRLAVELDRYDKLSEEVETVQQRCEGLLEAQQQEHQWELRAAEQVRALGKVVSWRANVCGMKLHVV